MNELVNMSAIKTWFSIWGLGVSGCAEGLSQPQAVCPLRSAPQLIAWYKRELANQKNKSPKA